MKIKKVKLLLLGLLLLAGCSVESIVDKESAKKLNADAAVQDFLLGGKYYELPCPVTTFIENGWELDLDIINDDPNEIVLPQGTTLSVSAKHKDYKGSYITLQVFGDNENGAALLGEDALVHAMDIHYSQGKEDVPTVVKGGITERTNESDTSDILLKLNEQTHPNLKKGDPKLKDDQLENEDGMLLLNLYFNHRRVSTIKIGNEKRSNEYKNYESNKDRNIKSKKEDIEKDHEEWDGKYEELLNKLETSYSYNPMGVHVRITITEKMETYEEKDGETYAYDDVFLGKDEKGNIYAMVKEAVDKKDYIEYPELSYGDTIDVWAEAAYFLYIDEERETAVPILEPKIIEQNGNMIYRSFI